MTQSLLSVRGLRTEFETRAGTLVAVNEVSFDLEPGRVLGLVGESGSGKSVTGFSLLGLVDPPGRIASGEILFQGRDLVSLSETQLRRIRGSEIAMIFQDPMMTLNPVLRIDTQMVEALSPTIGLSRREALERAELALAEVGIPSPRERLTSYPHELSGGMRQRVAIATAFLNRPKLIVADEPTTALDVTIQSQILSVAQKMCDAHGTALIWITHDLSVVAGLADEIAVMYAGRLVEKGPADMIIRHPKHPYTMGLLNSVPGSHVAGERLYQIPGMTPNLLSLGKECPFSARCSQQNELCRIAPDETLHGSRVVRCHNKMETIDV